MDNAICTDRVFIDGFTGGLMDHFAPSPPLSMTILPLPSQTTFHLSPIPLTAVAASSPLQLTLYR